MRLPRRRLIGLGLMLPAMPALADTSWPSALVMCTGRPGGDYMIYGPAWGELIQQETGISIVYHASGGAEANILLIDENAAQLGLTTSAIAHEARFGSNSWTAGARISSFRALFPVFPSILQIVSPRSTGITTLAELSAEDIGVGPSGSSGATILPSLFRSIGVIPRTIVSGDYSDQLRDMLAGKLAACAFIGAPPIPAISAIAIGQKLSLIGFSSAEAEQVTKIIPGMTGIIIGAGTFPGQAIAVSSVGTANLAICRADIPDSLAKAVTTAAWNHHTPLASAVPAASSAPSIKSITDAGITFHPGAAAALRAAGTNIEQKFVEP
jgi:uncharacterized protein